MVVVGGGGDGDGGGGEIEGEGDACSPPRSTAAIKVIRSIAVWLERAQLAMAAAGSCHE